MSYHLTNYLCRNLQRPLLPEWLSKTVTVKFSICRLLNQWRFWWLESPPSLSFYPYVQNHLGTCGLIQFAKLCSSSYQTKGYAADPECQQSPSFPWLSCSYAFATKTHSHTPSLSFPGWCSPAGVMATLKASSLKATRCSSAPPWRIAGTPAQRGPGAASTALAGHGMETASSGMPGRPPTPTGTLLTVKGRIRHLIAFSWQDLVFSHMVSKETMQQCSCSCRTYLSLFVKVESLVVV